MPSSSPRYFGVRTASGDALATEGILYASSRASRDSTASSNASICEGFNGEAQDMLTPFADVQPAAWPTGPAD